MTITGNNKSDLLDSLIKSANTVNKQTQVPFAKAVLESIKKPVQPSLSQILAQLAEPGTAPDAPLGNAPMGNAPMGNDLGNDLGNDAPDGNADAKNKLVEALISLCGGAEAAHALIDSVGGMEMSQELPDDLNMGNDLGNDLGNGNDIGNDLDNSENAMPLDEPIGEVSADMPMM